MVFRGLFVGIDRYPRPLPRLSFARADAMALAALLEDNFGGTSRLLTDDEATLANIQSALDDLAGSEPEDLVVISFSGHGTPQHQLSPFDFQPDEPGGSSLHLDELASALDRVPARQLIVVLDCCFADGFGGARVFAPVQERAPVEDRSSLLRLSGGSGRIVLTASNAGEPALEAAEYGHGLLTYYLIKALQSSPSGSRRRTWSTYRSPQRPTTPPRLLPPRPRVRGWSAAPDHPPRAEGWR